MWVRKKIPGLHTRKDHLLSLPEWVSFFRPGRSSKPIEPAITELSGQNEISFSLSLIPLYYSWAYWKRPWNRGAPTSDIIKSTKISRPDSGVLCFWGYEQSNTFLVFFIRKPNVRFVLIKEKSSTMFFVFLLVFLWQFFISFFFLCIDLGFNLVPPFG